MGTGTNECVVSPHTFMSHFSQSRNEWERVGTRERLNKKEPTNDHKTNLLMHRKAGRSGQTSRYRVFSTNDGSQQDAPTGQRHTSGNVGDVPQHFGNPETWTAVICPMMPTAFRSLQSVTACHCDGFVRVPASLADSTKPLRPLSKRAASIEEPNFVRLPANGMRSPLPLACQAGGTSRRFGRFVGGRGKEKHRAMQTDTALETLIHWVPDFGGGMGEENSKPIFTTTAVDTFLYC